MGFLPTVQQYSLFRTQFSKAIIKVACTQSDCWSSYLLKGNEKRLFWYLMTRRPRKKIEHKDS